MKNQGSAAYFRCMDAVLSTLFFPNLPDIAELKFFTLTSEWSLNVTNMEQGMVFT